MKTSKRILSAILASTVALSSYAAYAETAPAEQSETANSVTGASIPVDFGGTLDGDDSGAKTAFNNYLGDKPTAAYDSASNTVTVTFSKSKADYGEGQVDEKDPVYLVIDTNIANTVEATKDEDSETGFKFVKSGGGYWWDDEAHLDYNFKNGKIKLWLPAVFDKDGEETNTKTIKYKVGNDEKEINIKYEYGSNTDVTGAEIPEDFNGTINNEAKNTYNDYLGEEAPEVAHTADSVTVTFKKPKTAYENDGKVGGKDPVYLVIDTNIGTTVKAVGVDGTTAADGFQFTGGYGWDEDDHHEFNFAKGKIKLWLPAVLTGDSLEVTYKVGTGTEKTVTINYAYAEEPTSEKTKVKVTGLTAMEGIDEPETMTGDAAGLKRYQDNKEIYSFETSEAETDGDYEMTISGEFGKMIGSADTASGGKNVLVVLAFDKLTNGYTVTRTKDGTNDSDDTVLDEAGSMGWYTDGEEFVQTVDSGKSYFTLWISLTNDRIENGMEFTITPAVTDAETEVAVPTTLKITFDDTTVYTVTKDSGVDTSDYTVNVSDTADSDGKYTVTVTPATGKTITAVTLTTTGEPITFTGANGVYTGKVAAKELLSTEDIADGKVEAKITNADSDGNLTVTVAARSEIIAQNISLPASGVTIEEAQNERFQKNLKLYGDSKVNSVIWDADTKTATVKVPAELMLGTGATGQGAANVCLVLKLNTLEDSGWSESDENVVPATSSFVNGSADDESKYVVLWIGAGTEAFAVAGGDTKTVTYTDENGAVIATVNLVKVPGVKATSNTQTTAITIDPDEAAETETAVIDQAKINLGINGNTNLGKLNFAVGAVPATGKNEEVTVTVTAKEGEECVLVNAAGTVVDELTTTVKVSVAAEVKVTGLTVSKGIDEPATMTSDEIGLARYKHNKDLYSFGTLGEDSEGNSTLHINAPFGSMRGDGTTTTSGKNVLVVLAFDKLEGGYTIERTKDGSDDETITDITNAGSGTWKEHGSKFVTGASDAKNYFTLWISLTDDRIASGMEFTITPTVDSGDTAVPTTLKIDFTDTTEYTLTKDTLDETEYTVNIGTVTNGKATVTVTPVENKTITAATLTKGDGTTTVALTPKGDGSYTAEVTVKELISAADIADGKVAAKITDTAGAGKLSVAVAAQSTTVVATDMTVGIENPPTMAGDETQLNRYKANRELYANSLVWNATSKTATVKVPSELLDGATDIAQSGANVCLILKLTNAIDCSVEGSIKWSDENKFDVNDPAILDGYKFVDGTSPEDAKKYVALWINGKFVGDQKTVILYDKDGAVVTTVNLVKVPGVKPSVAAKPTGIDLTNDAIITAAKTLLAGDVSDDNLAFAVGTIPAASGAQDVTVTVTPKGDTVLVDGEGKVVTSLALTVGVTVAANATVNITEPTNGTFTVKAGDTAITDGETAAVGATITLTPSPATGYKLSSWTVTDAAGNTVTVASDNTFTMPAGGVTISATFAQNQTTPTTPGSGGGSWGGGGSSSGSSATTGVTLNTLPYATVSADKNAFSGEVTATLKTGESTTASGVTVKTDEVEKAANGASVKIEAPKSTYDINNWSREMVKNTASSKASEVKKSVDEAIKSVGDGKGFALYATITKDGKSVEPDGNVEITVSVPEAFKGKELHVYRITNRGAVEILANTANDKVTFMAGGSGEYIFTTEKLTNVKTYELGNVDGDAHTSAKDATLTLKYLIRSEMLKDEYLFTADADGNGLVNAADATAILKYLVEKA